jgi:glutathione-independent formaldehyde dehydrogenase
MLVDGHPDRLRLGEKIGVIPIDDSKGSPVEQVLQLTNGKGADKGCECVGYQAHDPQGNEHPNMTMNNLVQSVRPTGRLGVVGVFVPRDPNSPDQLERQGEIAFDIGRFWFKGQSMGTGQANVKAYKRQLRDLSRRRQGQAVLLGIPPTAPPGSAGSVPPFRCPLRGLDQGRA